MVLLEHVLPTGERHFDWLLERPGVAEGLLLAFRVFARVDEEAAMGGRGERYPAERMKDHRRVYLEFEGALTGGRGEVRRVAAGEVEEVAEDAGRVRVVVRWAGASDAERWVGVAAGAGVEGDRWWFAREA